MAHHTSAVAHVQCPIDGCTELIPVTVALYPPPDVTRGLTLMLAATIDPRPIEQHAQQAHGARPATR